MGGIEIRDSAGLALTGVGGIALLGNSGLSDNQARRLHGLFISLAVNALLDE